MDLFWRNGGSRFANRKRDIKEVFSDFLF